MKWMDFNHDGEVDDLEYYEAEKMLCSSRKEHEALFGHYDDCEFDDDDDDDEDDNDFDLDMAGLDRFDLEMMDEDERREALEDAGLDYDDFDF